MTQNLPTLIPVTDWNQKFTVPSLSMLRKLIFNANENGFDTVVVRIGRRVYINAEKFFVWVEAQNNGGSENAK